MTDLLELCAQIVAIPSESHAEGPLVDWLEAELGGIDGLTLDRVGDNLVARTHLGRPTRVLLVGHTDTVPANDNATPRIDGDVLWGLGASDMKAGLAVMVALARTLTDLAVDVTYVFYAAEEVAAVHNGLAQLFRERPDLLAGDVAIIGEPTDAGIEAGCQGSMRLDLTLGGSRAHAARPWMGRNAIHRLGRVLAAIEAHQPRQPEIDGCTYRETLQAVAVTGGVAGNVIPDEATLTINHRFAPDRTPAEAEAYVRSLLAPFLEDTDHVTVTDRAPAAPPALGHPILRALIDRNALEVRAKVAWTDVARFAEVGVPATNFGPGDSSLAHTRQEHVARQPIEACYQALAELLRTGP